MYAGHLAAGLALRGRARRVPVAAFLAGAFLLDVLWILFGVLHIDPTPGNDWSHSLLMSMVWATAFAVLFWRFGRIALVAIWLSVFSHFVLDLIVQGGSLYPFQPRSQLIPILVSAHARQLQLWLCVVLLSLFVYDERRANSLSWRTRAVCAIALATNARFLLGV